MASFHPAQEKGKGEVMKGLCGLVTLSLQMEAAWDGQGRLCHYLLPTSL